MNLTDYDIEIKSLGIYFIYGKIEVPLNNKNNKQKPSLRKAGRIDEKRKNKEKIYKEALWVEN